MAHFEFDGGEGEDFTLTTICQVHHWHAHHYDHETTVLSGSGLLELLGETTRILKAGDTFLVPAHTTHRVKALEVPFRFQCRFLHRDFEGRVVPTYVGNVESYT